MRFGLSFLPDATPAQRSAVEYYQDALMLAERADRAGLHFVKITEHYLHPYGGYCPSPLMFLSAVAARTHRIRLMTGGILPVFHHPVQIASHTAMLDALSNGRAEIGFARAWVPEEFDVFGVDMDDSRQRFVETIRAVLRLWTESPVTLETRFFSFSNVTIYPPCTQKPHPPVWVAAVQSRQSFAWIGQEGFKLLITPGLHGYEELQELVAIYRESFQENHPDRSPEVAISLPLYLHELDHLAIKQGDYYLQRYLDAWAAAAKAWDTRASVDYPRYTGFGRGLRLDSPDAMRRRGAALVGAPERVVEGIAELRDRLRVDTILWQIDYGAMAGEDSRRVLDLFVEEVWPACR